MWDWLTGLDDILKALEILLGGLFLIGMVYMRATFVTKEDAKAQGTNMTSRFVEIDQRLVSQDNRLLRIESNLEHLPTAEDFGDMKIQMTRIEGKLSVFDASAKHLEGLIGRLETTIQRHESIFSDAARRP